MVPVLGRAGTTTIDEVRAFTDAALSEKLARVRAAEAKAGRPKGCVRFGSTIFNYALTAAPEDTRAMAERLSILFKMSPEEVLKHPITLVGTPEEMADELQRREQVHGLSLLAINFADLDQIRDFGEKVLAKLR